MALNRAQKSRLRDMIDGEKIIADLDAIVRRLKSDARGGDVPDKDETSRLKAAADIQLRLLNKKLPDLKQQENVSVPKELGDLTNDELQTLIQEFMQIPVYDGTPSRSSGPPAPASSAPVLPRDSTGAVVFPDG